MSLVGSLEDLGLGDILQIISLSRKSGVLTLRCDEGEGRIHFRDGLVHGAEVKGGPEDLRSLLAAEGAVPLAAYDAARAAARADDGNLRQALFERTELGPERLEALLGERIQADVAHMFGWRSGEFSFEVGDHIDGSARELLLATGMSAQFLAMESMRRFDEASADVAADVPDPAGFRALGDELRAAVGEPAAPAPAPASELAGEVEAIAEIVDEDDLAAPAERPVAASVDAVAASAIASADSEPEVCRIEVSAETPSADAVPVSVAASPEAGGDVSQRPVVVVDPELPLLEWVKRALAAHFGRVHIFQRSELLTARVRQYLARAELPLVLISSDAPQDRMTGARDAAEIAERLRALSPRLPILFLTAPGAQAPHGACVERPAATSPAAAAGFGAAVRAAFERAEGEAAGRASDPGARRLARQTLERLKAASTRLHDTSARGEVLPLVMEFAASLFSRVAMFAIRDDVATGLAQIGLDAAGGPGDAEIRQIRLPAGQPECFRAVLERREACRGVPAGPGDAYLVSLLGIRPSEIYVGPIESGEQIVALLYADNLPEDGPIADTAALEVILHQAGLALDRTALERALAEEGSGGGGGS